MRANPSAPSGTLLTRQFTRPASPPVALPSAFRPSALPYIHHSVLSVRCSTFPRAPLRRQSDYASFQANRLSVRRQPTAPSAPLPGSFLASAPVLRSLPPANSTAHAATSAPLRLRCASTLRPPSSSGTHRRGSTPSARLRRILPHSPTVAFLPPQSHSTFSVERSMFDVLHAPGTASAQSRSRCFA